MKLDSLQEAIFDKMDGDGELATLVTGVYSDVEQPDTPDDATLFPYITIGRDTETPFDTMTDFGAQVLCQIDIWSRSNNFIEAKQIATRIWELLHHRALVISGADHVMTTSESATFTDDPDGHTKRGMLMFRVIYDGIG